MTDIENRWTTEARRQLLGRRIVQVRYMTEAEAGGLDWGSRPVVLQLDDGALIWAAADDEGNDGGAIFTTNNIQPVLPVL